MLKIGMVQGGALIGQGNFGCTFDTLPTCSSRAKTVKTGRFSPNSRKTLRVAKIVLPDATTAEISTSRSLMKIPNYSNYFILIDDYCKTDDVESDPDWEKCSLLKPGQRRTASFVQLRMSYGGIRLSDYARDIKRLLSNWLEIQIHLARALQMLHSRDWIHGDLHLGNILVDENEVVRIIDFGVSYNLKTLREKHALYLSFLPAFNNYAPEMDFVAGVHKGLPTNSIVNSIFSKKTILHDIDEIMPMRQSAKETFSRFANLNRPNSAYETLLYLKTYARCSDIWSLGYDFFCLYKLMITSDIVLDSSFYINHHRDQMRILQGMLHPDPRQRLTVESLLTELYTLKMYTE